MQISNFEKLWWIIYFDEIMDNCIPTKNHSCMLCKAREIWVNENISFTCGDLAKSVNMHIEDTYIMSEFKRYRKLAKKFIFGWSKDG